MIDNAWWCGKIVEQSNSRSPFLCYQVLWDNSENENLSPWDMEPINPKSMSCYFSLFTFIYFGILHNLCLLIILNKENH